MSLLSAVPCSRLIARPASKPMGLLAYSLPLPHTASSRALSRSSLTIVESDFPFHRDQSGERPRLLLRLRLAFLLLPCLPPFSASLPASEPLLAAELRMMTLPRWTKSSSPSLPSSLTFTLIRDCTLLASSTTLPGSHWPSLHTSTAVPASRKFFSARRLACARFRYCGNGAMRSSSFRLTTTGSRGKGVPKYFSFISNDSTYSPTLDGPPFARAGPRSMSSRIYSSKVSQRRSGRTENRAYRKPTQRTNAESAKSRIISNSSCVCSIVKSRKTQQKNTDGEVALPA
mmetsp:Transcript_56518/g.122170  ORF Transcript_56518/g.122170 Transcript_56518/m.122170 type:complete len:287 (-) Transcript_56518:993-1853(-)